MRGPTWSQRVLEELDQFYECEAAPRRVSPVVAAASAAAKAHYGEMRYNNANKIIVREYISRWLREEYPDMRHIDMIRHVPMAVEAALLPTQFAVTAQQFSEDAAVVRRRAAVSPPK